MQMENKNQLLASVGILLLVASVAFFFLLIFLPAFRIVFYVLYIVTTVSAATCLRFGQMEKAFGIAMFSILAATCFCFMVCGILEERNDSNPGQFGANGMTNLFEIVVYPFKFFPLAIPAIACWILSMIFEKWHFALHIVFGLLLSVVAIVNLNICLNVALNPDLLSWFLE